MKYVVHIARVLLGLAFLMFGLMGLLHLGPQPDPKTLPALINAMIESRYMFPLVSGTQLLAGVLLLANRFVPFALVLLAPVLVNIILFHVFVMPAGLAPGAIATLFEIFLVWAYRDNYRTLFAAKTKPAV